MRAWLSELFSELAYRLNDGNDPNAQDPMHNPPGYTPVKPSPIDPNYRFDAWGAQIQQRSMRLGPWIAVAASIALVIGLFKFWQIAAARAGNPTASKDVAQDVAKKFEDAYRINDVKKELVGGDPAPSAPSSVSAAFPVEPLIYLFPRNAQTFYAPPVMYGRLPVRPATKPVTVVYDPLADLMRGYTPEIEAADQQRTNPGSDNDLPESGGPVWRDGSVRR